MFNPEPQPRWYHRAGKSLALAGVGVLGFIGLRSVFGGSGTPKLESQVELVTKTGLQPLGQADQLIQDPILSLDVASITTTDSPLLTNMPDNFQESQETAFFEQKSDYIQIKPVIDEFRVNDYLAGTQKFPRVTAFKNGEFVVAWCGFRQTDQKYVIWARPYDNEWQPREIFDVTSDDGNIMALSIAALTDKNFVVSWIGEGHAPLAKILSFTGKTIKTLGQINCAGDHAGDDEIDVSNIGSDGEFAVSWTGGLNVYVRQFNSTYDPIACEVAVNDPVSYELSSPNLGLINNGYVTTWMSSDQKIIYAQRFNITGEKIGENNIVQKLSAGSSDMDFEPQSVFLNMNSNTVFAWSVGKSNRELQTTIYNSDWETTGNLYNFATSVNSQRVIVCPDKNNTLLATWADPNNRDGYGYGIFSQVLQVVNKEVISVSNVTQMNSLTEGDQQTPDVAALDYKNFVVVWQDMHENAGDIFGRVFVVNGTEPTPTPIPEPSISPSPSPGGSNPSLKRQVLIAVLTSSISVSMGLLGWRYRKSVSNRRSRLLYPIADFLRTNLRFKDVSNFNTLKGIQYIHSLDQLLESLNEQEINVDIRTMHEESIRFLVELITQAIQKVISSDQTRFFKYTVVTCEQIREHKLAIAQRVREQLDQMDTENIHYRVLINHELLENSVTSDEIMIEGEENDSMYHALLRSVDSV